MRDPARLPLWLSRESGQSKAKQGGESNPSLRHTKHLYWPPKLRLDRAANFPVVAERIDYAAHSSAMTFRNRVNGDRSGLTSLGNRRIRIGVHDVHAEAGPVKRFWTGVPVFRRLIAHPKLGLTDRKSCDYAPMPLVPVRLDRAESVFVKLNGFEAVPNKQPWSNGPMDI